MGCDNGNVLKAKLEVPKVLELLPMQYVGMKIGREIAPNMCIYVVKKQIVVVNLNGKIKVLNL